MARDNSPKERQKKQLERKQGRRASYDRILIVSEGSKTEPLYFSEIRAAYRLHTANVEVRRSECAPRRHPELKPLRYGEGNLLNAASLASARADLKHAESVIPRKPSGHRRNPDNEVA